MHIYEPSAITTGTKYNNIGIYIPDRQTRLSRRRRRRRRIDLICATTPVDLFGVSTSSRNTTIGENDKNAHITIIIVIAIVRIPRHLRLLRFRTIDVFGIIIISSQISRGPRTRNEIIIIKIPIQVRGKTYLYYAWR